MLPKIRKFWSVWLKSRIWQNDQLVFQLFVLLGSLIVLNWLFEKVHRCQDLDVFALRQRCAIHVLDRKRFGRSWRQESLRHFLQFDINAIERDDVLVVGVNRLGDLYARLGLLIKLLDDALPLVLGVRVLHFRLQLIICFRIVLWGEFEVVLQPILVRCDGKRIGQALQVDKLLLLGLQEDRTLIIDVLIIIRLIFKLPPTAVVEYVLIYHMATLMRPQRRVLLNIIFVGQRLLLLVLLLRQPRLILHFFKV